eukprot:GHUV01053461.1.p1 GENE.GHUV01053461.1~~GHUV01053461.1.p1  ORF type:complete len:107 (-),score=7.95 GHUV01053461.1:613-933(-)
MPSTVQTTLIEPVQPQLPQQMLVWARNAVPAGNKAYIAASSRLLLVRLPTALWRCDGPAPFHQHTLSCAICAFALADVPSSHEGRSARTPPSQSQAGCRDLAAVLH